MLSEQHHPKCNHVFDDQIPCHCALSKLAALEAELQGANHSGHTEMLAKESFQVRLVEAEAQVARMAEHIRNSCYKHGNGDDACCCEWLQESLDGS